MYGRRKVGKSFFVKRFTKWDAYFHVKRSGGILELDSLREIDYNYLKDYILKEKDKRIVVDEFHRLPEDFLDFLQAYAHDLNLVLITSTLWLSRKILGEDSPILGLFEEFRMNIVDERDAIMFLKDRVKGKELIDTAVYIREPWIIPLLKESVYKDIPRILVEQKNTVERLIGEIFREEERELKKTYLAIMEAVANGKKKSTEISSFLYSRRILEKDDASLIQSYLTTLCNIGVLERVNVVNKKYWYYQHVSPIIDLYFYLDSKYGFSEIDIPVEEVEKVFLMKLPLHVEQFFRNLLSKLFGLRKGMAVEKEYDVDIVLQSFRKVSLVAEVKWKKSVSRQEVRRLEERFQKYRGARKILIVPEENVLEIEPEEIEVWDCDRVVGEVSKCIERLKKT
ncbi:MAG: hypothetical protein DRN04_10580 [Thermoprotei archaeon]|nr:MAG: hypothetical protein DRN04_10580 [Thermoprotei archaeon]